MFDALILATIFATSTKESCELHDKKKKSKGKTNIFTNTNYIQH